MTSGARSRARYGLLFLVVIFAGMLTAGALPSPAPSEITAEVARMWTEHADLMRTGLREMMMGL